MYGLLENGVVSSSMPYIDLLTQFTITQLQFPIIHLSVVVVTPVSQVMLHLTIL